MKALAIVLLSAAVWAQEAPRWAHEVLGAQAPAYPAKVDTVVLLSEQHVSVAPDGHRTTLERGAVRIIRPHRGALSAISYYNERNSKFREFRAWLLTPGGRDVAYKPDLFTDVASSMNDTYNEGRFRSVACDTSSVAAGTVFAWEYVLDGKSVFTFDSFNFQGHSPTLLARYTLTLPPGWRAIGTIMNHPPIEPSVAGNDYTWELKDLPWIEAEEHSPSHELLTPQLGVRYFPPGNSTGALPTLEDWPAVSRRRTGLADPSAEVPPSIQAKAAALTAGAAPERERLARIATFVQQVNYLSLQMNLLRGGGFTPHRADSVLTRNYGDCKDKATLTRALLKAVGIESYLVLTAADDRDWVRPEWPSPQFNHAIVAVRVSVETKLPTVLEHPRLGRLLFFDPTDEFTQLGSLPVQEQGSHMLVLAGERGELVIAPLLDPGLSRVESEVNAELKLNGHLQASFARHYFGQSAGYMRSVMARDGNEETRKVFERSLTERLGGLEVRGVQSTEHPENHVLDIDVSFEVTRFSQFQGRLVLLRPGLLVPGSRYSFTAKERKLPVRLFAERRSDRVHLLLPAALRPDEIPDPVSIDSRYGKYRAGYVVKESGLLFEQKLEVADALVPASEYPALREFFDQIAGYQQSVLVLAQR